MPYILYRDELKVMETKLTHAKQRYQHSLSQAQADGSSVSALPHFEVHDRFLLNQDEAWYTLSIEIPVPIDHVMLQVSVKRALVGGCHLRVLCII